MMVQKELWRAIRATGSLLGAFRKDQNRTNTGALGSAGGRERLLVLVGLIVWPYIFLSPYTFNVLGIWNDFDVLYYSYKAYLLDNLAHFHLPLWSPSEACGFPFYSNPFAQILYPLNLPLVLFYLIFQGYSAFAHELFTIFGLSIFAVGFYLWMRSLAFDRHATLFATLTITVSFKLTEILRFPNAVHTAAWYPWILWSINSIFAARDVRQRLRHAALNMFFVFSLLTGGYLYYAYYSLFLISPYLLIFFIPALSTSIVATPIGDRKKSLGLLALSSLIPTLACAPYLAKVRRLLSQTVDRSGASFEYSTANAFSLKDTIGSLVFPPAAQSEGWYYIGCAGLLLIAILFLTKPGKEGTSPYYGNLSTKAFFILWIVLISLVTYGKNSHLFILLWQYMPGFRSLRMWGRMNILLVPILGWLLAAAYHNLTLVLRLPEKRRTLALAAGIFGVTFLVQLYFTVGQSFHEYWLRYYIQPKLDHAPHSLHLAISHLHLIFLAFSICSFLLVLYLLRRSDNVRPRALFLSLLLVSAADLWVVGPWIWAGAKKTTRAAQPLNVQAQNSAAFSTPRSDVYGSISLTPVFNAGVMENWYFERYLRFRSGYGSERQNVARLLGVTDGSRLFFSSAISHGSVGDFLADAAQWPLTISELEYTGEQLLVGFVSPRDGYLSFIDNWDPDWTVSVDGKATNLELLFGTFKSVHVPKGPHLVAFAYQPFGGTMGRKPL